MARGGGGTAAPAPGGGVYSGGEAGTRKRSSVWLRPPIPSQGAASRAGWGSLGGVWNTTGSLCLVLCTKNLPVQAESPQITPRGAGRREASDLFSPRRGGTRRSRLARSSGALQAPRPRENRWAGAKPVRSQTLVESRCWGEAGRVPPPADIMGSPVVVSASTLDSSSPNRPQR